MNSSQEITSRNFFIALSKDSSMHVCFSSPDVIGLCLQRIDVIPDPKEVVELVLSGTWLCAWLGAKGHFAVIHEGSTIVSFPDEKVPDELTPASILCYKLLSSFWREHRASWKPPSDEDALLAVVHLKYEAHTPEA